MAAIFFRALRSYKFSATNLIRRASTKPTTNGDIQPFIYNRNPRNLEKLRLEKKPKGYFLEKEKFSYWHKLGLNEYNKYVVAQLIHNSQKIVIEASTKEWAINKFLYSAVDKQAYCVLAQVFAERCLESGIISFYNQIPRKENDNTKVQLFLRVLQNEGLILKEMPEFYIHSFWYKPLEKRPWTVLEDSDINQGRK